MELKWRISLVVLILVAGVALLIPTMSPSIPAGWSKFMPQKKIHLGLDLQGGMHLVLEVQADVAVENNALRLAEELKEKLRAQHIAFNKIERTGKWDIEAVLPGIEQQNGLRPIVEKEFPTLEWKSAESGSDGAKVLLTLNEKEVQHIRKQAVGQGLETIRNRIDQFGVSEPDIRPEGEDRILIQLPGIQDPQRAVELIGKTALLEFKLVAENAGGAEKKLPPGVKMFPMKHTDRVGKRTTDESIPLQDRTLMTGEHIANARMAIDSEHNAAYVAMDFDPVGAKMFERITEANVHRQLAIVLDGVVYSAPTIQGKIGANATITGSFSPEEARDLAIVLRAGSLPAPVKVLEERTVGPALGQDSIHKGIVSSLVGGIGIILFMLIYYRFSGFIADLALIMNVILVLAGLALFGATLTLPGIAGIALTIGIAVDANVLIYERIREEMRLGKTPRAAVDNGYEHATKTIMDANITSLIAAAVLFQFGTGPVKGFAVTLSIGLIANLFTAIVVTRVFFDYLLTQRRVKALSI